MIVMLFTCLISSPLYGGVHIQQGDTAGGDLSGTYPNPILSSTTVTAGSYGSATQVSSITVNARGRITGAENVTITGVPPGGSAGGDLTGTYPNPTLTTTGVASGTYGSATQVSSITVDLKGRITSASNVAITGVPPGGSAGGDLSGTYPNPSVSKFNVTSGTTTRLNTTRILWADGTVQVSSPTAETGDISSVTAGYGLSGGGTSGDVTLNLRGDTTSYVQNTSSLQSNTTFYVTSGTVQGNLHVQNGRFRVIASASNAYEVFLSTTVNKYHVMVSTTGHFHVSGSTPTLTLCGTSPSITGSDIAGTITTGTGGPTSCTMTFANAYVDVPSCVVTINSVSITPAITSASTTAITISFSAAFTSGTVYYHCFNAGTTCTSEVCTQGPTE